jgi:hypothetical protein
VVIRGNHQADGLRHDVVVHLTVHPVERVGIGAEARVQPNEDLAPVVLVHEPRCRQLRLELARRRLRSGHIGPATVLGRLVLAVKGLEEAALVVVVAQEVVIVRASHVDDNRERLELLHVA